MRIRNNDGSEQEVGIAAWIGAWIMIALLSFLTAIIIPIEFLVININLKKRNMHIKRKFVIGFWIFWVLILAMTGLAVVGGVLENMVLMWVPFAVLVVMTFAYNKFMYGQIHIGPFTRWFHLPRLIDAMHENAKLESTR